ncbi:MAG: nucleotidyltransferase domain-containing protein [Deltaproteobacteria bacterium]|nr:nucleotidyltransferase domain-containing protein [Deltaproteobacteria bacterium]
MNPKIQKAILDAVLNKIDPASCIVFLYGSYATGEDVESSDIDVGLLCADEIPAKDFLAIQEEIQNNAPTLRKIDLVDFHQVSEKIKKEALKEIKIWHTGKNCHALLKILKPPRQN